MVGNISVQLRCLLHIVLEVYGFRSPQVLDLYASSDDSCGSGGADAAPEVLTEDEPSLASDMYSFGLVLQEVGCCLAIAPHTRVASRTCYVGAALELACMRSKAVLHAQPCQSTQTFAVLPWLNTKQIQVERASFLTHAHRPCSVANQDLTEIHLLPTLLVHTGGQ